MSEMRSLLASIVTAAAHTPACGNDADGDLAFIAWADDAALRHIYRLGTRALALLPNEEPVDTEKREALACTAASE
jgi:hypothetical protein